MKVGGKQIKQKTRMDDYREIFTGEREVNALLFRRSLYCSKKASEGYSVCTLFDSECSMVLCSMFYDVLNHPTIDSQITPYGSNENDNFTRILI